MIMETAAYCGHLGTGISVRTVEAAYCGRW